MMASSRSSTRYVCPSKSTPTLACAINGNSSSLNNGLLIVRMIETLLCNYKSKNSLVRLRIASYFEIVFKRYDIEILTKS